MRVRVGLIFSALFGFAVWWLGAGGVVTGLEGRAAMSDRAASSAGEVFATPDAAAPAGFNDPWALLRQAEASNAGDLAPMPVEVQKAMSWLDPAKDADWCSHLASGVAARIAPTSKQEESGANDERVDEITLAIATRQTLQRWAQLLRQRGNDARSLAAADYLQAMAASPSAKFSEFGLMQQRAIGSQDGHVLALATQLVCQQTKQGCQALVSRWLQLEPRNGSALSWQFNLLPPDSPERLEALTRLAEAQFDAESQRFWAEFFQNLPRTGSAGLSQAAEQSALEYLHWAGSGPMYSSWAMFCRKDKRPATGAVCASLAERIWQSESANLLEKSLAVLIGKSAQAGGTEWAQRELTLKSVLAASARWQEEAGVDIASALSCKGVAARHNWQQRLVREGEWRIYSQLAAQSPLPTQPVLRSPAAIPLIDK
ncbi:hypothetical protein LNV09_11895 [Paucibacter sp. B2R-40]|uniref:hypothetical protein n=1 Tax=Paucibacter sp. B2R-40 TaxID=2893554 RepID=UPI0021E450B9|nr:hypothetical protein [Paucibacter sp. B2R-40]MCV2354858.1 hypothetical protein [Paucibacter sp. B2R-40]